MKNNNDSNKNPYIYDSIIIKREYSKELEENINQLKKDLVFFLDKNKHLKRQRAKPININTQINKIINKIENSKEDHGKLLKSLQINNKRKNKRFFSAKEIEKFRERKRYLLKIINEKSDAHKTISNADKYIHNKNRNIQKKHLHINKFNKTVFDFKNNKSNLYDNKTFHYDKSLENISLGHSNIYSSNNKYNNRIRLLANRNFKFKKRESLFRPDSTKNRKTFDLNFNNHLKLNSIRDIIEDKEKINLQKSKKDNSSVSINYNIEDNIDPEDMYNFKKKMMLEKLKSKVDKFENSNNFCPEDKAICKCGVSPFTFLKRGNLSQFELDVFDKEENRKFINKRKRIRKINSIERLRFNKTQTYLGRNKFSLTSKSKNKNKKSNPKIIIKKINIIKRKANNRRINMKSLYKNKNFAKTVIDYFSYDEGKIIDENLENDIKSDVIKYKKNLGNFTYVDGKFVFSGHLQKMKP